MKKYKIYLPLILSMVFLFSSVIVVYASACDTCHGSGTAIRYENQMKDCQVCNGSGQLWQDGISDTGDCDKCDNGQYYLYFDCSECQTSGKWTCSNCNGVGTIYKEPIYYLVDCFYCDEGYSVSYTICSCASNGGYLFGLVQCDSCGNVMTSEQYVYNNFSCSCSFTDVSDIKCTACDNGSVPHYTRCDKGCNSNGLVSQVLSPGIYLDCVNCESGKVDCEACYGEGQIVNWDYCPYCNGKGIITSITEGKYIDCSVCDNGQVLTVVGIEYDCPDCDNGEEETSSDIGAGGGAQGGIDTGLGGGAQGGIDTGTDLGGGEEETSSDIGAGGGAQGGIDTGLGGGSGEQESTSANDSSGSDSSVNILQGPLNAIINFVNWFSDWCVNLFDNLREFLVSLFVPTFNPVNELFDLMKAKIPISQQLFGLVGGFINILENYDYSDYQPYIPINFDLGRNDDLLQGVLMYKCNNCDIIMTVEKYVNNDFFCTSCGFSEVSDYYFNSAVIDGSNIAVSVGVNIPKYFTGEYNTFDVSWYAPYRETINNLLSAFLWLAFAFSTIKFIPKLLGGIGS